MTNQIPHVWTQQPLTMQPDATSCNVGCTNPSSTLDPNPAFPSTASLGQCTPLAVTQSGTDVFVTVSIPAEAIFTLPTLALEIKRVTKNVKITQCRFFNTIPPIASGQPSDTPKLFLAGFVRKDIQYSQVLTQTSTTVQGSIQDFVVDVPISCVVSLGTGISVPATTFGQQQVYEFATSTSLPAGFASKDQLLSADLSEFNVLSNEFLNKLPTCHLVYSQINEMDEALDRVPLVGGPFEEGVFRTVQEKMVVVIQVRLAF
ncbi:Hypothetical protein DEACI_0223 [Acididesulfobacillus acetoxydans]|uniref:DUF3794 domain-containing protein n=1 Tax=Acididesulfobacillus acetoxydans TaxID=1561005 RepID=A0A8S0XUN0_9FIRM|nr:hypothetical protein [Acididesulfobacillus acetoxydans]CAA7599597.1 Hypothetical protein DEACI_0223 [Acididesulfobacillus acetoxydans]CEJ07193.1 Hypothetical protein DEACI_1651 [Acididesulfobacillus acetoxydans]